MAELTEIVETLGPDVIYVVLMVGIWLAITAVYVPGTGLLEVAALGSLVLAAVGLIFLPVNIIGVILLTLALGCFLALIYFRHSWPLIIVGAVLQLLGSIFLFRAGSRLEPLIIVIVNAAALAFHQIILLPGLRIQDMARRMDAGELVGLNAQVVAKLDPVGTVRVRGEVWTASSAGQNIEAGRWVRIVGRDGLQLRVVPSDRESPWDDEESSVSRDVPAGENEVRADIRRINLALVAVLTIGSVLATLIKGLDGLLDSIIGPVLLAAFGLFLLAHNGFHLPDRGVRSS